MLQVFLILLGELSLLACWNAIRHRDGALNRLQDISASCRLAMKGDTSAQRDLEEIYDLDVLGEIGKLNSDRQELAERSRTWHSAVADFDRSWEVISSHEFPLRKPSRTEVLPILY